MNICVYSSSSNAIADCYFSEAEVLGKLIGERGHKLVNGGAGVGLMETITVAAKQAGAETLGIIPEKINNAGLASGHSHEIIVTEDMQQRKAKMRDLSDAFIALPGGFGTLEEILEVLTLKQLSYHHKPVVFINTNNFFSNLFNQFEVFYSSHFAKEQYRQLYFIAPDATEAIGYIENYSPPEIPNKWYKVPERKD